MTPREYYNVFKSAIEDSGYDEIYCKILEAINDKKPLENIRETVEFLHHILIQEVAKDRGEQDFYNGNKEDVISEWDTMLKSIPTADYDMLGTIATVFYDAIMVEKIRTFAFMAYEKGAINNYAQLADEMHECYLDEMKADGLYDEWRGSETADIDSRIGDGPGLYDK